MGFPKTNVSKADLEGQKNGLTGAFSEVFWANNLKSSSGVLVVCNDGVVVQDRDENPSVYKNVECLFCAPVDNRTGNSPDSCAKTIIANEISWPNQGGDVQNLSVRPFYSYYQITHDAEMKMSRQKAVNVGLGKVKAEEKREVRSIYIVHLDCSVNDVTVHQGAKKETNILKLASSENLDKKAPFVHVVANAVCKAIDVKQGDDLGVVQRKLIEFAKNKDPQPAAAQKPGMSV